jgi:hypothetical protein
LRISGTQGLVPFESVAFTNVRDVTIDLGSNDNDTLPSQQANDVLIIEAPLFAAGLRSLTVLMGPGDEYILHVSSNLSCLKCVFVLCSWFRYSVSLADASSGNAQLVVDMGDGADIATGPGFTRQLTPNTAILHSELQSSDPIPDFSPTDFIPQLPAFVQRVAQLADSMEALLNKSDSSLAFFANDTRLQALFASSGCRTLFSAVGSIASLFDVPAPTIFLVNYTETIDNVTYNIINEEVIIPAAFTLPTLDHINAFLTSLLPPSTNSDAMSFQLDFAGHPTEEGEVASLTFNLSVIHRFTRTIQSANLLANLPSQFFEFLGPGFALPLNLTLQMALKLDAVVSFEQNTDSDTDDPVIDISKLCLNLDAATKFSTATGGVEIREAMLNTTDLAFCFESTTGRTSFGLGDIASFLDLFTIEMTGR